MFITVVIYKYCEPRVQENGKKTQILDRSTFRAKDKNMF